MGSVYFLAAEAGRYRAGEISEEDYNAWRYHYPKFDKGNIWAEVPPDLKWEKRMIWNNSSQDTENPAELFFTSVRQGRF